MIRSSSIKLTAIAIAAIMISVPAIGADDDPPTAQEVADHAIANIVGWQLTAARDYLKEYKGRYGSTDEFRTAWNMLQIMEASGTDEKTVVEQTNALGNTAKKAGFTAPANYWRGELLYQQNKRGDAKAAWKAASQNAAEAVTKDPDNATAQFYLGASLVRERKFGAARSALLLAERGGFDPAMVQHQIGLSHLFAEEWQSARKAFDRALETNPQFAPSYFWRGMARDKLGKKAKLVNDLDQFVKLAPNAPEAGRARAVLRSAGG